MEDSESPPQPSDSQKVTYRADVVDEISSVPADHWNALAGDANPFMRHEFLAALERNGCVGEKSGWAPRHLLLYRGDTLVGAMPMYLKSHSYGEFVFDWGWADAYERAGLSYYPKLVVAAPFTPATGPRLLRAAAERTDEVSELLAAAAIQVAQEAKISSVHWLFAEQDEIRVLESVGLMVRWGNQFHWSNPGFRDFQDYLDQMTSKKRKQIRRERRDAQASPVKVDVLLGRDVEEEQWEAYHALYASTYDRKWGYPSLTADFFKEVGQTMGDSIMLAIGRHDGRYVAGAHLFKGPDALYGRNWGCSEFHPALHFEMCYYRPMEHCIDQGLVRFEAGAQGEHKLSRGFLPVRTQSAHWIAHDEFRSAIAQFLDRERRGVDHYLGEMDEHSPFKADFDAALSPVAGAPTPSQSAPKD